MSRELIDAITNGDNVEAQNAFNSAVSNKVGDALETKRREISKNYVKAQVEEDDSV
jgi:L-arabinose isomerase